MKAEDRIQLQNSAAIFVVRCATPLAIFEASHYIELSALVISELCAVYGHFSACFCRISPRETARLNSDLVRSKFFAQRVQGRGNRLDLLLGNANGFRLFQTVTCQIAHDRIVLCDHA